MKTQKILCPVDFSTLENAALEVATSLWRDRGATLIIAHVEEIPLAYGAGEYYYGVEVPVRKELERMLKAIVPKDKQVKYEHRLVVGEPAEEIVHLADKEEVDMIVLATHGRTGLFRLLMGSVAEAVVRKANCPVLTVKAKVPEKVTA